MKKKLLKLSINRRVVDQVNDKFFNLLPFSTEKNLLVSFPLSNLEKFYFLGNTLYKNVSDDESFMILLVTYKILT